MCKKSVVFFHLSLSKNEQISGHGVYKMHPEDIFGSLDDIMKEVTSIWKWFYVCSSHWKPDQVTELHSLVKIHPNVAQMLTEFP